MPWRCDCWSRGCRRRRPWRNRRRTIRTMDIARSASLIVTGVRWRIPVQRRAVCQVTRSGPAMSPRQWTGRAACGGGDRRSVPALLMARYRSLHTPDLHIGFVYSPTEAHWTLARTAFVFNDRQCHLFVAQLHVRCRRRWGLLSTGLPPHHPCVLQGAAVPQRGIGDPRDVGRAGHAAEGGIWRMIRMTYFVMWVGGLARRRVLVRRLL